MRETKKENKVQIQYVNGQRVVITGMSLANHLTRANKSGYRETLAQELANKNEHQPVRAESCRTVSASL